MSMLSVISGSGKSVPGAPTIGTATNVGTGRAYNNGAATVTFTAPAYNGRSAITSYTVTSSPGGFTGTGASSPITVTGLASATAYTFTVTATNAIGTSSASSASNSITATTVPQAPTIGTATAGSGSATVTYTAGATGGAAVSVYTATSSPGSFTGTGASPITVSGLTNGTAYTFTVTATNANGTSSASAASNSVTPVEPSSYESIASFTPSNSTNQVQFTSIPQGYRHLQIRLSCTTTTAGAVFYMELNGNSSNVYDESWFSNYNNSLYANYNQNVNRIRVANYVGAQTNIYPFSAIIDVVDYTNTSKNKTVMSHSGTMLASAIGYDNGGMVGTFRNTSAVSTILLFAAGYNFGTNNTISLYGIK